MTTVKALRLHVTGVVQGVGFRPFVYNLAVARGLAGWVLNASDGVHIHIEGAPEAVRGFTELLEHSAPEMAVIECVEAAEAACEGFSAFEIRESVAEKDAMTLISPDIATCAACLGELFGEGDRRAGYPFINCTNCGPRFTIIEDVPYDRPLTTMRAFEMCPECAAEYGDPGDRRFHAQPDACFVCGPRLYLNEDAGGEASGGGRTLSIDESAAESDWKWQPEVETGSRGWRDREAERVRSAAILDATAERLVAGEVLAIKGLGGFQLACDATSSVAVAKLRERKRRWGKPLAVMVPDVATARAYCEVGPAEEALLAGAIRPIVLLVRSRSTAAGMRPLAEGVADELAEIGVMLPYTPLHHLLMARTGGPLVMTSGNLSDEPIVTDNAEALEKLAGIADAFLLHDRTIYSRYDDSVVRVVGEMVEPVRRARGLAPRPLSLPFATDIDILGAGPEQKNTFTLLAGEHAFVSQHIGDLENAETMASYLDTLALYERLFRVKPQIIAHDLHPEYLSTKWALEQDLPRIGVQHHHAHIASVTAEHGVDETVIGIALDGTGYGSDGRIWGGEVLLADWAGFSRFAHLRYVPMPGGAGAIRRPARMALGTLVALDLLEHPGAAPLRTRLAAGEDRTLRTMIERSVNSPLTSSMGRLFDTVASLAGVADDARYEGEAAILLEAQADQSAEGAYEFALRPPASEGGTRLIDPAPVLAAVLDDVATGESSGAIAMRFHRAVVACIVSVVEQAAEHTGTSHVALGGGVFMNRLVLGGAVTALERAGFTPLTHVELPANDGAISHGQAVIAWANRHRLE